MKRIGIISDTHGYWDERYEQYLGECDEIWHAGDIGSMEVADRFEAMKPIFRAVHGNIDGGDVRRCYPERLRFRCEDLDVLLELCDRILVLCGGKVSGIVDGRAVTKEEIGLMMTKVGGKEEA